MPKPRMLIFSHWMELGGAETALLGLLESLDRDRVEVDLFLMRHTGELLPYIPDWINVLPESPACASLAKPMLETLKMGQIRVVLGRLKGKKTAKKRATELGVLDDDYLEVACAHKHTLSSMPQIGLGEYDLAISFLTPHYMVANRVHATKKIAWIHTDYSFIDVDLRSELDMWSAFDRIVSISTSVTESFLKKFPQLEDRIILIENILPTRYIASRADDASVATKEMASKEDGIKLLSIGRFTKAKAFDRVPNICASLVKDGLDVRWYLIGYGGDENLIRQSIEKAHMENRVIVLGKRANPYPYISACDVYVQPSRYEGKCVAVREAQLLGKPVIITDFPTSSSQLRDGKDGIIVPMDEVGCAKALAAALNDERLLSKLMDACRTHANEIAGATEINKLYALLDWAT